MRHVDGLSIHGFDTCRSFRVKVATGGPPLDYQRRFHQALIELDGIFDPVVADVAKSFRCVRRFGDG